METAYLKICRLLATSGFREHEVADFLRELYASSPSGVMEDIAQLRRQMSDMEQGRFLDGLSRRSYVTAGEFDLGVKIERLLLLEAGMSKVSAVEHLTAELRFRYPEVRIPPESRKGFLLWIRKLARVVPEKELLHIATNLRNRYVHEAPSDWRLK